MINIQRILCPTSLLPESDEGLRYAVALARAYEAKLFLCLCEEAPFMADRRLDMTDRLHVNKLFETSLAPYLGLAGSAKLDWEGVIVKGESQVGVAIAREAAERRVDLIVMRSRRRPRAAVMLGSTAETVCRTAPCPVLVSHPQEREWGGVSAGKIVINRVLAAHDFSSDSELALNYALSLSQEYGAELHLLHVLDGPSQDDTEIAWGTSGGEGPYHEAARNLQKSIPPEAHLWCKVVTCVRWGKPHQEVLAYAGEQEVDLVCLGASGEGFSLGTLFGSNVDRVLRQAPCPVLVARPQATPTASNPKAALGD